MDSPYNKNKTKTKKAKLQSEWFSSETFQRLSVTGREANVRSVKLYKKETNDEVCTENYLTEYKKTNENIPKAQTFRVIF